MTDVNQMLMSSWTENEDQSKDNNDKVTNCHYNKII